MEQTHGKLIAEFDTKLSGVFLHRFFTLPVLAPIAFLAGFIYLWISDDNPADTMVAADTMVGKLLLLFVPLLLIIVYCLFFRKMYKAEIYERGLVLTEKRSRKVKNLSFDQILNVRDIVWTHRYSFIPFFKRRVVEIHVKDGKRCISMDAKNMMQIKTFSSTLTDAFNIFRGVRS